MTQRCGICRVVLFGLVGFFVSTASSANEIKLAVGTTALNNIFRKIKEPFEKETGITLTYDDAGMGSDAAMKQLDAGHVEGAAIAAPLDDVVKILKEKNYVIDAKKFTWRIIGGDRIQVLINKDNGVKKLSHKQVTDLFSGKAKNWKEVGGADLQTVLVATEKMVATQKFVEAKVMSGAKFRPDMKKVDDGKAAKMTVAATAGAFTVASAGMEDGSVLAPVIEPAITRPLPFVTKGPPSENVQKLLRFIKDKGDGLGVVR